MANEDRMADTATRFAKAPRSLIIALDPPTLRILLMLATHADYKTGRDAFPSVPNMAKELGVAQNTIRRAFKIGVEKGLLKRRLRFTEDGRQTSTCYDCLWLAPLQPVEGGGCNELKGEASADCTRSEPVYQSPKDQKNTHPPVGGIDVFESDVTAAVWKKARNEAKMIADFWNENAGVKPYTLPEKHVPWQLAGAYRRWTPNELGQIMETVRDSDYCNGTRKHAANLLWAMTPEFGDKLLAGQYDDE